MIKEEECQECTSCAEIAGIGFEDPRDKLSNPTLLVIGLLVVTAFIIGAGVVAPKILK